MPEQYAHDQESVLRKLGVKAGQTVALAHEARAVDAELSQWISGQTGREAATAEETPDLVLAMVDDTTDFVVVLKKWRERLMPAGGIWLLTTKRGQPGYVDQRELIAAGQQAGVVDNKICSLSPTLSAMRFVIRKEDRRAP